MDSWINEAARKIACARIEQMDALLAPLLAAGINPQDYVLVEGPIISLYRHEDSSFSFSQDVRLRRREDDERLRYRCACGEHRYSDRDFTPGQVIACLRCHDIFTCDEGGAVTVHYPPPREVYEDMYQRSLEKS